MDGLRGWTLNRSSSLGPTPTASDATGGPGLNSKRQGGPNLRTAVAKGMWPTPTASEGANRDRKPRKSQIEGTHGWTLGSAVGDAASQEPHGEWPGDQMLPTPTASMGEKGGRGELHSMVTRGTRGRKAREHLDPPMFATPTTQDASNNAGPSQFKRNSLPLNAQVGGALNPEWVSVLMGFPPTWTEVDEPDSED